MDQQESGPQSVHFPNFSEQQSNVFQFPLNSLNLEAARSEGSNPSTASTLYDPAILAMSPEFRAVVEQRQSRVPFQQDQGGRNEGVLHVSTPAARKPVQTPAGETTIRLPEEGGIEEEEEKLERELCCHGLLPLYPSMTVFNIIHVVS